MYSEAVVLGQDVFDQYPRASNFANFGLILDLETASFISLVNSQRYCFAGTLRTRQRKLAAFSEMLCHVGRVCDDAMLQRLIPERNYHYVMRDLRSDLISLGFSLPRVRGQGYMLVIPADWILYTCPESPRVRRAWRASRRRLDQFVSGSRI